MNKIQEGGNLETTTQIMTRSEAKRKELDLVLKNTLFPVKIGPI